MNILVTAIGSLSAEAVIKSLKKNEDINIIGCDIHPAEWIAISNLVNRFYQVPASYEAKKFIDKLIKISKAENINYIIPLTDPEVDILDLNKNLFAQNSVKLCIPDSNMLKICRDKLNFYTYLKADPNINLIPTYDLASASIDDFNFPVVLKPRKGRSSEGLLHIKTKYHMPANKNVLSNYIVQPFLIGDIYTVDLIRNKATGKGYAIQRKELIRTKNGAGMTVKMVYDKDLDRISRYFGEKINLNGCINLEFINFEGKYLLMDINPRFSAGVAFSILAGYDIVINHLRCFLNEAIDEMISYNIMTITRKISETITDIK